MPKKARIKPLIVQSNLESLAMISEFISLNMKNLGIGNEKIAEVQIAVDEAFTNIVQHSSPKNGNGDIEITCNRSQKNFEISIKNYGKPFNPVAAKITPDLSSELNERSLGGLGIHFIKNLMDDLKYEYCEIGGYEILTMVKYV